MHCGASFSASEKSEISALFLDMIDGLTYLLVKLSQAFLLCRDGYVSDYRTLVFSQATQANSAWPSLCGRPSTAVKCINNHIYQPRSEGSIVLSSVCLSVCLSVNTVTL